MRMECLHCLLSESAQYKDENRDADKINTEPKKNPLIQKSQAEETLSLYYLKTAQILIIQ